MGTENDIILARTMLYGKFIANEKLNTISQEHTLTKTNTILSTVNRHITCKTSKVIILFSLTLIRPLLSVFCFGYNIFKKADKLERVQRTATKPIKCLENKIYRKRLSELVKFKLKKRRLKGGMICLQIELL